MLEAMFELQQHQNENILELRRSQQQLLNMIMNSNGQGQFESAENTLVEYPSQKPYYGEYSQSQHYEAHEEQGAERSEYRMVDDPPYKRTLLSDDNLQSECLDF